MVMLLGPVMDPRVAFDVIQRLPHLAIRMREHSRRTKAIADVLNELGAPVNYPGLKSHPQYDLICSIINEGYGFGGMLTLDCKTNEKANQLMSLLQNKEDFGYMAVSLGYYDTLMSCTSATTSSEISPQDQDTMGLSPGLVRISIGFTGSLDKRIEQIKRAVKEAGIV